LQQVDAVDSTPTPAIRLLSDHVLIRLIHPERMSHGLWIPDSAKRQPYELWRAEVIAVGPGARIAVGPGARTQRKQQPNEVANPTPIYGETLQAMDVQPGDIVGFYWAAGRMNVTKWPDDDHRIIHESAIQYKEIRGSC